MGIVGESSAQCGIKGDPEPNLQLTSVLEYPRNQGICEENLDESNCTLLFRQRNLTSP